MRQRKAVNPSQEVCCRAIHPPSVINNILGSDDFDEKPTRTASTPHESPTPLSTTAVSCDGVRPKEKATLRSPSKQAPSEEGTSVRRAEIIVPGPTPVPLTNAERGEAEVPPDVDSKPITESSSLEKGDSPLLARDPSPVTEKATPPTLAKSCDDIISGDTQALLQKEHHSALHLSEEGSTKVVEEQKEVEECSFNQPGRDPDEALPKVPGNAIGIDTPVEVSDEGEEDETTMQVEIPAVKSSGLSPFFSDHSFREPSGARLGGTTSSLTMPSLLSPTLHDERESPAEEFPSPSRGSIFTADTEESTGRDIRLKEQMGTLQGKDDLAPTNPQPKPTAEKSDQGPHPKLVAYPLQSENRPVDSATATCSPLDSEPAETSTEKPTEPAELYDGGRCVTVKDSEEHRRYTAIDTPTQQLGGARVEMTSPGIVPKSPTEQPVPPETETKQGKYRLQWLDRSSLTTNSTELISPQPVSWDRSKQGCEPQSEGVPPNYVHQ